MNPGDVAPMIMGVVFFIMAGVAIVLRGPIGKALARRIGGDVPDLGGGGPQVLELQERVAQLERDRDELLERVEFAERLLSRAADQPKELR